MFLSIYLPTQVDICYRADISVMQMTRFLPTNNSLFCSADPTTNGQYDVVASVGPLTSAHNIAAAPIAALYQVRTHV